MSYLTIAEKLEAFLKRSASTAYAEPQSDLHTGITKQAWERVKPQIGLEKFFRVLDLGCGSGLFMDLMAQENIYAHGVTCVKEEFEAVSVKHPYRVLMGDIHDPCKAGTGWDLIWLRHAAEHSPAPAFLLSEAYEALGSDGWLYLEVPSPETSCQHESNPNHYSVLGTKMWAYLLMKAGFEIKDQFNFSFVVEVGPDVYTGFLCKKAY